MVHRQSGLRLGALHPVDVTWHKHWLFGAPVDYWVGLGGAALILWFRHRRRVRRDDAETVL